jgi:hypothetical protein
VAWICNRLSSLLFSSPHPSTFMPLQLSAVEFLVGLHSAQILSRFNSVVQCPWMPSSTANFLSHLATLMPLQSSSLAQHLRSIQFSSPVAWMSSSMAIFISQFAIIMPAQPRFACHCSPVAKHYFVECTTAKILSSLQFYCPVALMPSSFGLAAQH